MAGQGATVNACASNTVHESKINIADATMGLFMLVVYECEDEWVGNGTGLLNRQHEREVGQQTDG